MPVADQGGCGIDRKWSRTAWFALAVIAVVVGFIAMMAAGRSQFGIGVEVDTHVTYIPEARRLAAFDTLQVKYHLPGYPAALGLTFMAFKDWLAAGLVVSVIAAALAFAACYHLFNRLWGPAAGFGAVMGLAASFEFLSFGAQATSDMPYFMSYAVSLMFAVRAIQTARPLEWFFCGAFVASAILVRTSGVALLPILLAPLLVSGTPARRLEMSASAIGGFALIAWVWLAYCVGTDTPFVPQNNHVNLALTYYTGDARNSADQMLEAEELFSSSTEVLLSDPSRVLRIYWEDLRSLPGLIARELVWWPMLLLGLAGSWIVWRDRRKLEVVVVVATTLASLFLLNLHSFAPRFHFNLLPLFGALAGTLVASGVARYAARPYLARVLAGAAIVIALTAIVRSGVAAQRDIVDLENLAEFEHSIPAVARLTERDAWILTRKFVVPNYAKRQRMNLPVVDNLYDLCKSIVSFPSERPGYLYIGREERRARPSMSLELENRPLPAWLKLVEARDHPVSWQLYRIVRPVVCD